MEIYVVGSASKCFKPNLVKLAFTFKKVEKSYQEALQKGSKEVEEYLSFLIQQGFSKEDFKTRAFSVYEEKKYNEQKKVYEVEGYRFTQEATLQFDYNVKKFADILEKNSNLKNAPFCSVKFALKDERKARTELYVDCVNDAKEQAEIIAKASGLKLSKCLKISSQDFDTVLENNFARSGCVEKAMCYSGASDSIQNTFVPEDICAEQELHAIWLAE